MVKSKRFEVHVVPCKSAGLWLVVIPGEVWAQCETKAEAVAIAKDNASELFCELIVHNADGRIAYRNSYGNDRKDRRG